MFIFKKFINLKLTIVFTLFTTLSFAENHNLNEILELIQKDLKTLEKAVYSGSTIIGNNSENSNNQSELDQNSEDVLTRHLLKLSEIEDQFRELTNKFEEINFKLDKLSNRLSKVQADNQIRFQDIENAASLPSSNNNKISAVKKNQNKIFLPGSSQPQELGSISYKDSENNETSQQIQSIETTS